MQNERGEDTQNMNAESKDGLYARITALSQESGRDEICPEPEELAAFVEGRLRGPSRKKIIRHLNDCVLCRRHWQMVQSTFEEMDIQKASWMEKFADNLKSLKQRWFLVGGGLGLAAVTCLLLIFLTPHQKELSEMITQSYRYLPAADVARYNSFATRGFEDSATSTPAAYNAGVTTGADRLRSKNAEVQKPKDFANNLDLLFYSMGQWSVVLQCSCISHEQISNEFWSAQKAIAVEIQHELKNAKNAQFEVEPILESLIVIQHAAEQILKTGSTTDECEEITFAFQNIEKHLRRNTTPTY